MNAAWSKTPTCGYATTRAFPEWAMGGFIGSPEAKEIYARHGMTGGLEASSLTADQVIGLAQDLAASEQLRQARRTLGR
nr:hypothetical protein [Asticcacaulis sp. AC466]